MRFYYCLEDENGVTCVDQVASESQSESDVARLALGHPRVIYFAHPHQEA